MSVNPKLLDIGCFDSLLEMQIPTKDQRCSLIRAIMAPVAFQGKELVLQKQAQMTEYFSQKDLACIASAIFKEQRAQSEYEAVFDQIVRSHKSVCFPASQR